MNEGQANGAFINVSQQSSVNPLGHQQRVMFRHFPDDPPQIQQQFQTRSPLRDDNQPLINNPTYPKSNLICATQEPENRVETTHHQNIMEQNSELIRQLRQSHAQISQNQKEAQDQYMQNYLNQSLRGMQRQDQEEVKQRSLHSSMDQHRQVNARNFIPSLNQPPAESVPNHQRASSVNQNNRNVQNQSALSVHNLGLGNADSRKNDKQYACLIIRRAEFFCTKDNLIKHSNYLMRVYDKQEFSPDDKVRNSQLKIKLPDSTKADILIMFLDFIDKGKELPNQIDLYIAQNVILIAEALKMRQIEKKFLLEILMPMLNRENIIFFTKMSYNKLTAQRNDAQKQAQDELESQTSHDQEEGYWLEFFSYALDFAALHILYLLKKKSNEMLNVLETQIIEEIIERGIKFYRADLAYDSTLLFDMLMKIKKCDSIFQLLEQEKQKILESEQKNIDDYNLKGHSPTLTWKIQSLSGNFYKESDPFLVENAQWKLSVSYFRMDEEALSVQIKMVNNPFEVKKSKDYFKKKEFFLPSNVAGGMQNQTNFLEQAFDDENLSQEEIQKRRKQMEQANSEFPAHSFITIVSSVRIDSNEKLSDPVVNSLICSAKTPALLRKFVDFRIEDYKNTLNVEISIKVKYSYSAILLYISKNFTYLITDPHISLLPKEQFKLLLKHKMLNVTQEDEVIKAICMWAEGQDLRPNLDTDLSELLENVNWNFVTLSCLLDLIRNFTYVRRNMTFHKIINKEFTMRNKFNEETSNLDAPRHCYKYNKTQNISLAAKEGKNAKALLYINHDNFFQNLIDQMLEPVDIIKAHLVNEGINESSHRKHLELQLFQKKREMQQIEDQLFNMRLMDEMDRPNSRAKRPNSQVSNNQTNSIMKNGNNPNISEFGDDVETVKNSMINLLNVMVEDSSKRGSTQQNVTRGHKLFELSQEAIQKMQYINNSQMDQVPAQRVDSEFHPANQDNPQTFENMYQELESMAQNKKIQIMFKTLELDEEEQKNSERQYEEERKSGESQDQQDDNQNTNSVIQITPSQQVLQPASQIQTHPNKQHTTSQSSQIIFGGASIVSPKQQHQDQQTFAAVPQQNLYNRQYQAIIAESKSIQTSLQNIVQLQQRSIGQSRPGSSVAVMNSNAMRDQSVQMTFDEPPETPIDKQQSMIKGSETIRDEEQEHHHFVSHSSVHSNRLNQDSGTQQSVQSLRSALEPEKEDKVVLNEKQQQFELLKMKYQKKFMQEYTSMVQKMSKDVFDENFLKNIQLFSPGCSQGQTADMTNSYVVPSPFSTMHNNNQMQGQVSVKNPKVHNLNISIHNNANYSSPFTDQLPTQPNFTPLDRNMTLVGYPQKLQSPIESKQKAIPLKSAALSKVPSPHNNLQKNIKQNMQAFVNKQKPKSAQQYSHLGYKKPQNMIQLQIDEQQNQTLNSSASGNTANYPHPKYQGMGANTTSVANQNYQTMLNNPNQHEISYAAHNNNSMKNLKTTSKANRNNNHSLLQKGGIMVMPGSTKNSSSQNKQQIYNYQGQQQMHQKVVKASNNKNQQNKFILQTLLNETQKVNQIGESLLQGKQPQIMMTIDPSTQPTQGGLVPTPKSQQQIHNYHHHQKSSSVGGNSAFLNQWAVMTQGQHLDPQMIPQTTITTTKMRDKSNEQLQNEIIRMIVEDIPVPQMQHNNNYQQNHHEPKLQNWVQPSQTPQGISNMMIMSHSFHNKRSSVQQPMTSYVGQQQTNFNILDDIKHQVAQTPQYQSMLRPQFVQQQPSNIKPQSAGFGSLATHQRLNSSANAPNGGGSVMLDLAQLKKVVSTKNQQQPYVPLGTIEELKTGPPMESENGMPEAHNKTYQSQQSMTLHGRRGSQQLSSSGGRAALASSQSLHSSQQAAAGYNRCQPRDISE